MAFDIEAILAELIETIKTGVVTAGGQQIFKSVAEPGEKLPQANPFCWVEETGGPIELGNLEDWTLGFRITVGVHRKAQIVKERQAVRQYRLQVIAALRANIVLNDEATLTGDAEATGAQQYQYGDPAVAFMGCQIVVRYQATEGVAHLISD